MNIKVPKDLLEAIGWDELKIFGIDKDDMRWHKSISLDLTRFGQKRLTQLVGLIEPHQSIRGSKSIMRDCALWSRALGGEGKKIKPKSVKSFESLLRRYLQKSGEDNVAAGRPVGPRLYHHDEARGVWFTYYVSRTTYMPSRKESGYYYPAYANVSLQYIEFGKRENSSITFHAEACVGLTVEEALARKGYIVETDEMRAEYERRRGLFREWCDDVGKQFLATGIATDDMDGNGKSNNDHWYHRRMTSIQLDKLGEPSRVVIDVFTEDDSEDRSTRRRYNSDSSIDKMWWIKNKAAEDSEIKAVDEDEDEYLDDNDEPLDLDDIAEPEVPIHPMMAVFDMSRHLRLRIDVGQLAEYVYDSRLGDKLVLPSDSRNLVEMLLAHKSQFRDIVKGKSGGAIILCAGVPGTGKTLTSEVYAEVMARPLYTVQASQLGTDPDELEEELLKTFARASRWNAIMLLDEADVYVHTRGNDLTQNAIVGVFLRVLEYYKGVLFLTTNRSDLVDDAIASRCVARIDYKAQTAEDQKAIWNILAETAGITIKQEVIDAVVKRYPELTGRDVKNLLKLAELVTASRDCEITEDVIRFVKRFKPTVTAGVVEEEELVELPPMPVYDDIDTPPPPLTPDDDWRVLVLEVFEDGAPHAASEVKTLLQETAPGVHPNAITNALRQFTKQGKLSRLESGLYRAEGES